MPINDIKSLDSFFTNLKKDDEGHVVLNMFDNTILNDSFLASALKCSAPGYEIMPEKVRFVKDKNPWEGITYFTDKTLHMASQVESTFKIGWLIEPGDLIPGLHNVAKAVQDNFDFILTYEQNLLDYNPKKFKFLPCDTSGIEKQSHKIHQKTKLVSMIYSNKKWLTGHKIRHMIADSLISKIKYDKIDLLGRATNRPLELKSEGTNDYMFQIAIENLKRKNYFADKIYDCFVTGTVPIYWGAPNIGDFFDIRGILVFNNPRELTDILKTLSREKYDSMLPYVEKNFELVKKYLTPDDLLFEETKKYLREKYEPR